MKNGIVILNYNNYELTQRCVNSIQQSFDDEICIVIVDNGSCNDSYQILLELYSNSSEIILIKSDKNLGFSAGNNIGINYLMSIGIKKCILANSDILFEENSIQEMFSSIEENVVICGPKIFSALGIIQHSTMLSKRRFIDYLEIGRFIPYKKLDEENLEKIIEVYSVSGCCFAINIDLFKKMSAFDENVFLYCEEMILGYQAKEKGYRTVFNPNAIVIHKHMGSSSSNRYNGYKYYIKSLVYYLRQFENYNRIKIGLVKVMFLIKVYLKNVKTLDIKDLSELKKTISSC